MQASTFTFADFNPAKRPLHPVHWYANVKQLYEDLNGLIQLPRNQNALSNGVESVVEGSLVLLDACDTTIDLLSQLKDCVSDLSSSLRRRSDSSTAVCMTSRKKIIKIVSKCLENLKKAEKDLEKDSSSNTSILVRNIREAESICLSTLRSVLAYVSRSKKVSKVAKLMKTSRRVYCDSNVFEKINSVLDASKRSCTYVQSLLKQVEMVEMDIIEIKDTSESVSRCLVKTRVSLPNIVSQ